MAALAGNTAAQRSLNIQVFSETAVFLTKMCGWVFTAILEATAMNFILLNPGEVIIRASAVAASPLPIIKVMAQPTAYAALKNSFKSLLTHSGIINTTVCVQSGKILAPLKVQSLLRTISMLGRKMVLMLRGP